MDIFWFRRDLRINDNTALYNALINGKNIQPIFIFDDNIVEELPYNDARITFIYQQLDSINVELKKHGSSLKIFYGDPYKIFTEILYNNRVNNVYINRDYEPYALERDSSIFELLKDFGGQLKSYKDQVVFEQNEVVKKDGLPYSVFTPFKNKWLEKFRSTKNIIYKNPELKNLVKSNYTFPSMEDLGFEESTIKVPDFDLKVVAKYDETRNFPSLDSTSKIGPHLRFGTVSIREIVENVKDVNSTYLSELIWRKFFMQILWHFPKVVKENFRAKYDGIQWRNKEDEFKKWCEGKTGYPLVDAGMRELNATGFMHNRVRMVTASFLCKHLLIDWRWGEAYFAEKLLDYELASNNGNWQWSAGTGCDAAPYFRVFNPSEQIKKFDNKNQYINKWIPELNEFSYPQPMVEHPMARQRAIETYKEGINSVLV